MFGKKDSETKPPEKPIALFSIEQLPGRAYTPIGLVRAETTKFGGGGFGNLIKEIREKAQNLGADAIVGYREVGVGGAGAGSFSLLSVSGTAIVFSDKEQTGGSQ